MHPGLLRSCALLLCLAPAACDGTAAAVLPGAVLVTSAAAIPVVHRDLFDVIYSAITGRDCSVVRLDRLERYCKPIEPPPAVPPYCTRSLATVDCWRDPARVPGVGPQVADGPDRLTPAQEADRTARWPPL